MSYGLVLARLLPAQEFFYDNSAVFTFELDEADGYALITQAKVSYCPIVGAKLVPQRIPPTIAGRTVRGARRAATLPGYASGTSCRRIRGRFKGGKGVS